MNKELQDFARNKLKDGLRECTAAQQLIFKHMYSHKKLDMPIDEVVDGIPSEKLSWAMEQVNNTKKKQVAV